jgi:hypothetical protein
MCGFRLRQEARWLRISSQRAPLIVRPAAVSSSTMKPERAKW